jgi:hypothetical protein
MIVCFSIGICQTNLAAERVTEEQLASPNAQETVSADEDYDEGEGYDPWSIRLTPYPATLTLTPGSVGQLNIRTTSIDGNEAWEIPDADDPYLRNTRRYKVSNKSVAKVSADGLITALKPGQVTITVEQQTSRLDENGAIREQASAQTKVRLLVTNAVQVDEDDATPAPRQVVVNATQGGAVQNTTGETVLIGAGAFTTDIPVGIARIPLADIEAITGIKAPGQHRGNKDFLQALGAFRLEFPPSLPPLASLIHHDDEDYSLLKQHPLQLAIPVQIPFTSKARNPALPDDGIAHAGDSVYFFKKDILRDGSENEQSVWWLVDAGIIGADGVARTVGSSYAGVFKPGDYIISRQMVGNQMLTAQSYGNNQAIYMASSGMAFSPTANSGNPGLPISAGESNVMVYSYQIDDIQQDTLALPPVAPGNIQTVQLPRHTNRPVRFAINPRIDDLHLNRAVPRFEFTLHHNNLPPSSRMVLKLLDKHNSNTVLASKIVPIDGSLSTIDLPPDIAAGDVRVGATLIVPTQIKIDETGVSSEVDVHEESVSAEIGLKGLFSSSIVPYGGATVTLSHQSGIISAHLTREKTSFYLAESNDSPQHYLGNVTFSDTGFMPYGLPGLKVNALAIDANNAKAFVAGMGRVWAIDLFAMRIYRSFTIGDGMQNITSLVNINGYLCIAAGNHLWLMRTTPGQNYGKTLQITHPEFAKTAPYGFTGMATNATGTMLVLAAPQTPLSMGTKMSVKTDADKPGNVIVLDLYQDLHWGNGKLSNITVATLPADGKGFSPYQVHEVQTGYGTTSNVNYAVTNALDYDHGLAALSIQYDAKRKVQSASLRSIDLSQPEKDVRLERLNIQRALNVELVRKGKTMNEVQYAIVSDDNQPYLDSYSSAMHPSPDARPVIVGGKLGIVRDPFGTPVFLGATAPQRNMRYGNLSRIGNTLYVNMTKVDTGEEQVFTFDINALIDHAEAHGGRLDVSIGKHAPEDATPQELIPVPAMEP